MNVYKYGETVLKTVSMESSVKRRRERDRGGREKDWAGWDLPFTLVPKQPKISRFGAIWDGNIGGKITSIRPDDFMIQHNPDQLFVSEYILNMVCKIKLV